MGGKSAVDSGAMTAPRPHVVILGGGLVEAMPDLFVGSVTKAVGKSVMPSFADSYRVVAAQRGDDATVMGAAAWCRQVVLGHVDELQTTEV